MEALVLWIGFRKHRMLYFRSQVIGRSEACVACWAPLCCGKGQGQWRTKRSNVKLHSWIHYKMVHWGANGVSVRQILLCYNDILCNLFGWFWEKIFVSCQHYYKISLSLSFYTRSTLDFWNILISWNMQVYDTTLCMLNILQIQQLWNGIKNTTSFEA